MIIDGDGSETIDGATTVTLGDQYDCITITAGASAWFVVNKYEP
jgi:hypothetical protein